MTELYLHVYGFDPPYMKMRCQSWCWCFMICCLLAVGYLYIDLAFSWSILVNPNKADTSDHQMMWIQPQRNALVSYILLNSNSIVLV